MNADFQDSYLSQRRKDTKKPVGNRQEAKGKLFPFLLLAVGYWLLAVSPCGKPDIALGADFFGIISGLVQDQAGNPVVGARVEARSLSGSSSEKESVTDYEGRYHLDSLPAGAYQVTALPPEDSFLAVQREILGVLDGLTTRYDFTMPKGGGIEGRVVYCLSKDVIFSPYGDVVRYCPSPTSFEGLTIKLQKQGEALSSAITDAKGQYRFANILPDEYELGFESPQMEFFNTLPVAVKPGEIEPQDVSLVIKEPLKPESGSIAGRVETESGMPLPQAAIYVWGLRDIVQTDIEGDFLISNLLPKNYTLIIIPPADLPLVEERITVSVKGGETTLLPKIILKKPGGIFGQIRDEAGNPVAGARIEANLRNAQNELVDSASDDSDPEGRYYIGGLVPGVYKLDIIELPDNLNLLKEQITGVEVRSGSETNKDITLLTGGIISGTVTDKLGKPVPDALIKANGRKTHTDLEGKYTMISLPPAIYTLKLSPPEGRNLLPLTLDNIKAATGEITTRNFILQAGGVLTGTVTDPAGNPIADSEVEIEDDFLNSGGGQLIDIPGSEAKIWIFESQINEKTITDRTGTYRFEALPPGSYRIRVDSPGELPLKGAEEDGLSLSLSETVIKDFTLSSTNLIQGKVIDHNKGAGQRNFIVAAREAGKPLEWNLEYSAHTLIEEDSSYRIKDLPAGRYNLYLILETPDYSPYFSPGRILISKSPEISLGSTQFIDDQDIEVDLSGGGLSGQIAGRAETVMALSPDGTLIGSASIGQGGRYMLAPLPEGEYTVKAILTDGSSVTMDRVSVIKGTIMANIDLSLESTGTESNSQASFNLDQVKAYPNPFYPGRTEWCTITGIPSEAEGIKLRIYTIIGELVKDFEANELVADSFGNFFGNCVKWDGRNDYGHACASGIYIYYLKCGQKERTGKIAIVR